MFWVEYRRELRFPREGVFKADRDDNYFRSVAVLFGKKTKTKKRWEDVHPRSDVHASWKKVKCLYLYSTDIAFTQHKHDKYSLQTKGQMPADKEIFEWHVKFLADLRRIRGARDSITIFIG